MYIWPAEVGVIPTEKVVIPSKQEKDIEPNFSFYVIHNFRVSKLVKEFIKKYYLKKFCVIFFILTLWKKSSSFARMIIKKIKKIFKMILLTWITIWKIRVKIIG